MADPSHTLTWLEESVLLKKWPLKAALYLGDFNYDSTAFTRSAWQILLSHRAYPLALLLPVPLLSVASAFTGVALSWTLQRGILDPLVLEGRVVVILLVLLFIISLARSLIVAVRQRLLIQLDAALHLRLHQHMLGKLFRDKEQGCATPNGETVKSYLNDIQRVRAAMVSLISVLLSDGLTIIILCSAAFCFLPLSGVIELLYLAGMAWLWSSRHSSVLSDILVHNREIALAESSLIRDAERLPALRMAKLLEARQQQHSINHQNLSVRTLKLFRSAARQQVKVDALGMLNVVIIWSMGLYQWHHLLMSYSGLMTLIIVSYFVSTLTSKVLNSLPSITEGADAAVQLKAHSWRK